MKTFLVVKVLDVNYNPHKAQLVDVLFVGTGPDAGRHTMKSAGPTGVFEIEIPDSHHHIMIDQPLATYRLHTQAKTAAMSDAMRLDRSIQVSRRYWGAPWTLNYWMVLASYGRFRLNRLGRARALLRGGEEPMAPPDARRATDRLRQKEGISYGAYSFLGADPFDRVGRFGAGPVRLIPGAKVLLGRLHRPMPRASSRRRRRACGR